MKKSQLRLGKHLADNTDVIEVWYGDKFIATVYGADGPGVRVISKYAMGTIVGDELAPNVVTVKVKV